MTGSGGLTNSDLQGEAEFAQKTRPEALLSFKFPQPKLPSNTLFRAQTRPLGKSTVSERWDTNTDLPLRIFFFNSVF